MFKGVTGLTIRRVHLSRPLRTSAQAQFDWDKLSSSIKDRLPNLDVVRQRFPVKLPRPFWQKDDPNQTSQGPKAPPAPKQVVQDAARSGTLGFGFSAGGMLFPYYLGVLEALTELGLITGQTQLGGASAGALLVACHHSGLPMEVVTEACLKLAADCREQGTRGRLGKVLNKYLLELLPDDSHERCKGKAFIAVTKAFPIARPDLISEWTSKEDLVASLMTSCHIPWWFDNSLMTTFRGALHYDGGLTNFIPLPPELGMGVRVCCLPAKQLNVVYPIDITPDAYEEWPYSASEMLAWAFEPASETVLMELIAKGRKDAYAWAQETEACGEGTDEVCVLASQRKEEQQYPGLRSRDAASMNKVS